MAARAAQGRAGGLAAAGLFCICAQAGLAQTTDPETGRPLLALTLSERLAWKDGDDLTLDEEGLTATTGLALSLSTATPVSDLKFDLGAGYRQNLSNGRSDLYQPRLTLTYGRESPASSLDFDLSFRQDDIDSTFLDDDLDIDVVRSGTGTRNAFATGLGFAFGRDAPFGGSLDLDYRSRTYTDTDDPGLLDREYYRGRGRLDFRIDPRITAFVQGTRSESDYDGGRDELYRNLAAGAELDVTQTLSADLILGYSRITESGSVPEDTQEGPSFEIALTEARPNGVWTASFDTDINTSGQRRDTARIGREMALPRGSLAASAGLSRSESDSLSPLYALSYTHERPRSVFDVSLDQVFTTDDDGDEVLNSRLNASWLQLLTELASIEAGLVFRSTDYLGDGGEDDTALDLNLTYRHSIARDWDIVGGYTHRIDDDGSGRDRSDEIYLTIEKSFWRRF